MIGRVVSTKTKGTVTVLIERTAKHPLYKKTYVQTKKYLVDDPIGVKDGDVVDLIKVRPISKNKHWKITKVIGKNLAEITEEKLKVAAEKTIAEVMPEEKIEESSDVSHQTKKVDEKKEKPSKQKEKKSES